MTKKTHCKDLAFFGGQPSFKDQVYVGRPNTVNRQQLYKRIDDMLDRRWYTNGGPYVQEFEQRIQNYIGVKHCIALCNATVALEIAIRATGMQGEVIIPSFTFIATAHALQWQEITPVFCDIDPHTHNIDTKLVERMITPRTTGIIGVHVWGRACDVDELTEIAKRNNLKLVFDAAHAFSSSHNGKMIGNFGEAEVFSFHATKFFNTFEGGAIVTNDDALAKKIRLMKNFGFAGYDNVIFIGTNGKMTEVCAAMGLTGFEKITEFIGINQRNYNQYKRNLSDIDGLTQVQYDGDNNYNYSYIILEIDEAITGISRDQLTKILHAENIIARRYFYPGCHQMEPYRSYYPHAGILLPVTERLCQQVLVLPTGTAIEESDIDKICEIIILTINNSEEIVAKTTNTYES